MTFLIACLNEYDLKLVLEPAYKEAAVITALTYGFPLDVDFLYDGLDPNDGASPSLFSHPHKMFLTVKHEQMFLVCFACYIRLIHISLKYLKCWISYYIMELS